MLKFFQQIIIKKNKRIPSLLFCSRFRNNMVLNAHLTNYIPTCLILFWRALIVNGEAFILTVYSFSISFLFRTSSNECQLTVTNSMGSKCLFHLSFVLQEVKAKVVSVLN
jgi:hypothetical protein